MEKEYLGDSVYIQDDGIGGVFLTTENGDGPPSNEIYLEDQVIRNMRNYFKKLDAELAEYSRRMESEIP